MFLQFVPQFPMNNDFVNFIYTAREYLDHLINDLFRFIEMIEGFAVRVPEYLFWLPTPIAILFGVAISIAVFLMIVGKEH